MRDNRPPKAERTLKGGDIRDDGMIFMGYSGSYLNGERWVTAACHKEKIECRREREKNRPPRNRPARKTADGKSYPAEYEKNRRKNDPEFRVRCNLKSRLYHAVKNQDIMKCSSTMDLTGCSAEELMSHLESQFTEGMTRDNYGKWHVDHIKPCISFNLLLDAEQRKCFHYSNLQPLWAKDNLSKGANYQ
jgi:hypothetical protein